MKINSNKFNLNFKKIYEDKKPNPKNTVAILGASKTSDGISKYERNCAEVTKALILSGKNILTGCGSSGIMGAAYKSAKENSKIESGKPVQNLAIIKKELWGDEDLENCVIIGQSDTETERTLDFIESADTFVIYPGSAGTIKEITNLIFNNNYDFSNKKVILVGKDYYKGLDEQYKTSYKFGQCRNPKDLYSIAETPKEILEEMKK